MQQNNKCMLCDDRNETVDLLIMKFRKLEKKMSIREYTSGWGKWLCKKFKSDFMSKWYMQNPESLPENETHKILWEFEV